MAEDLREGAPVYDVAICAEMDNQDKSLVSMSMDSACMYFLCSAPQSVL